MALGPCTGSERITGEGKTRIRREAQPNALSDNGPSDTSCGRELQGRHIMKRKKIAESVM
jgi:hypothetical protein